MKINCRAQVSKSCYNGRTIPGGSYEDEEDYRSDGTYQSNDGSIVCDACYIKIGQPSVPMEQTHRRLEVINTTLAEYKAKQGIK